MRRAFVVLVLLAMMVGLKALKTDAGDGSDPLTLAAIGFVLLAAFAVAELGAKFSLPKVTGYILSGIVLGPFALGVLSDEVVLDMKMFSKLALGLIAISAGLELDLRGLRALAKTLGATIFVKLVTGVVLVGGTLVVAETYYPMLGLSSSAEVMAMGVVFAAFSIGTSPSISLAILSETQAKGRLSDLVLGAAVVKDVVVVISLAVAVAIARGMVAGGADAAHASEVGGASSIAMQVGRELGASTLVGLVLGGLLILYLRFVRAEMLLFVAAMVLVVVELSAALHLELLLVFIVAGLVVRNLSSHEHDLLHPLETVSLPVFIVFFTNAGASVNLDATFAVLPLALALCVARAIGFVVAARVGGRIGGESEPVRKLAWLGYLPLAGVTLGLVGLASTQLPELASSILTLGMAVVAVNLLIGPITLRVALQRAGEIGSGKTAPDAAPVEDAGTGAEAWETLEAEPLRAIAREIHTDDQAHMRALVDERVRTWVDERVARLSDPLHDTDDHEAALATIAELIDRIPPDDAPARVQALLTVHARSCAALEGLPGHLTVPLEAQWRRAQPGDGTWVAFRKRSAALGDALRLRIHNRTRTVPTRILARTVVEPGLARALEELMGNWYRAEVQMLEQLRRCVLETATPQQAALAIRELGDRFVGQARIDVRADVDRVVRRLVLELGRVGSPPHPASGVRYSAVEPELERWSARMVEDGEAWASRRDAAIRLLRVTTEVALIERRLRRQVEDQVITVADEAFERLVEEVGGARRRLAQIVARVRELEQLDEATLERTNMEVSALVPRPAQKQLRALATRLRRATSGTSLANFTREGGVTARVGRETIVHSMGALIDVERPARGELVALDVSETVQAYLSGELVPWVEQVMGEVWSAFAAAREALSNCEGAAEFALSSSARASEDATPASLADQLVHAGDPLDSVAENAAAAWGRLRGQLREAVDRLDEHLVGAIATAAGRTSSSVPTLGGARRWGARVERILGRWFGPLARAATVLRQAIEGEVSEGIGRHYRLRSRAQRADATDLRALVAELETGADAELPALYRALFADEPVRDPRLFVANRDALQDVVRAERDWQQEPARGNGVLVVGAVGAGKTSLVHIARLKLATRRIIVVPPRARVDEDSLLGYLGRELGCVADTASIRAALDGSACAIVIDDLHEWLREGAPGTDQLAELLGLIESTRRGAFWLISIAAELLEAQERLLPVRAGFAQVIELGPLSHRELDALLDARHQLSGFELAFQLGWRAQLASRVMRRSDRESYLRELGSVTRGNPRRALQLWTLRARMSAERCVELLPIGVSWGLPLQSQLTATQLSMLATLLRTGRRGAGELARALSVPTEHVARELPFLVAAGLVVEHGDAAGRRFELVGTLRNHVGRVLADFGAVVGGEG